MRTPISRMGRALLLILALLLSGVLPAAGQTTDPRAENARAFAVAAAGRVVGVELQVEARPWTSYELVQARLIDENAAGGNTVASYVVVDCFGTPISENVYLAWPWPTLDGGKLLPGNQNAQHMVTNGYSPPALGPLAVYVGDAQGRINSDVVGGLGLPFKRHVSFFLAFKRRCGQIFATATPMPQPSGTPQPTVTPAPSGGAVDLSETNGLLRQILAALEALARHFGVSYTPAY